MTIKINGQNADITLDLEKTVGDFLAAMEQWLENSGHRLSGLAIDGEAVGAVAMEAAFSREVQTITTLDIFTSPLHELSAQSLIQVYRDSDEYENLGFDEKQIYFEKWKESPQAKHLAEQIPDIFALCSRAFSGDTSFNIARTVVQERLREFENPAAELSGLGHLVDEVCRRLEELPLDIQTGKDARAAETIQIFTSAAEKLFRIFNILGVQGFPIETIKAGEAEVSAYIAEFNAAVKEILAAYEQQDTVLIGDIAEYELAPRLRVLTASLSRAVEENIWALQA